MGSVWGICDHHNWGCSWRVVGGGAWSRPHFPQLSPGPCRSPSSFCGAAQYSSPCPRRWQCRTGPPPVDTRWLAPNCQHCCASVSGTVTEKPRANSKESAFFKKKFLTKELICAPNCQELNYAPPLGPFHTRV